MEKNISHNNVFFENTYLLCKYFLAMASCLFCFLICDLSEIYAYAEKKSACFIMGCVFFFLQTTRFLSANYQPLIFILSNSTPCEFSLTLQTSPVCLSVISTRLHRTPLDTPKPLYCRMWVSVSSRLNHAITYSHFLFR